MSDAIRCDLVIVGGGPAGLGAAVTAASEGLDTRVIAETVGGQASASTLIENYLGFPDGLTGAELTEVACKQATKFGADLTVPHLAVAVESDDTAHRLTLDDGTTVTSRAVLLATGARYHRLDVPGADRLTGRGIYYGSALDVAEGLAGRDVAVVGGANSAAQSVLHLARFAAAVHLLVRGSGLEKMSQYLTDRITEAGNVRVYTHTNVLAVAGDERVNRLLVSNGKTSTIDVAAVFVFIGASPPTRWLEGYVDLDSRGFVLTGGEYPLGTSKPGVFAAGDVRAGSVKRVASAVGEGAQAVQYVHAYLEGSP